MPNKKTVLVVDDERKITQIIESYLKNSGYEVVCAYDGTEALELFEKYPPALVILDLMLPELSGEQVCARIRKKSRVPIIMLTAKIDEDSILNGLHLGAD
ncbi:MAG: hypothetical protein K0R90_1787, partial [Oscillospiraceae bacterium]|nr:hypothetical protein [Oscillospiraceae bacterium]